MTELASYIFKPKHGPELAMRIIERFCNDFLNYEDEGFYLHWRSAENAHPSSLRRRPLSDGYVEFIIETENGNLEAWTECCYSERELEASDLTESFFAMLPSDFWYRIDGKPEYNFYERELADIVGALSDDDSRVVSFGNGRSAWVRGTSLENHKWETIDLLDYVQTVPIVEEKQQSKQLRLADWL